MSMKKHHALRNYLDLPELFERAKHIGYVILSNHERLPLEPGQQIDLLTDNVKGLLMVWDLIRVSDNLYRTQTNLSSGNPLRVRVFEKGKRTFPDTFESQLLTRRVMYREVVAVPDSQSYFLLRLYWRTFYEDLWKGEPDRAVMIEFLKRHVGEPITPKARDLQLNKKKVG